MKIRNRMICLLLAITILITLLAGYVIYQIEKNEIVRNSEHLAEIKIKLVENAIRIESQNLEKFCIDWAVWDDTYEFIEDLNKEYISSNLIEDTFRDAKINSMIFIRKDGEVVFSKFYDVSWSEREIPAELLEILPSLRGEEPKTTILMIDRPLVIASSPILRSDWSGEIRGWLVMARYLDDEWVSSLESSIDSKIYFESREDFIGEKIVKSSVYDSLPITVEFENVFYPQFTRLILTYYVYTILGILSAVVVLAYLIDRFIVSRLLKFEEAVRNGEKADEDDYGDEISNLISNYNRMLEKIKSSEEDLRFLFRIMRHDLANIITAAFGYLELAEESEMVRKARRQLERCTEILNIIRSLETEKREIYRLSDVLKPISEFHGVEIEMEGDAEILADEGINIVFDNLIRNAVKHGKATKIFAKVESNHEVRIHFWDNGSGFPENAEKWIFNPEKSHRLGLLIVKGFIEKYGGSIEFLGGSKFLIRLPKRG